MSNNLFINAINGVNQLTPPIWFMRQAGRYHSHYQKLKEKYTFEQLCKTPELASEVACGPIKEFDFDVSILFSDILFPLEGLGLTLDFKPGPIFTNFIDEHNYKKYTTINLWNLPGRAHLGGQGSSPGRPGCWWTPWQCRGRCRTATPGQMFLFGWHYFFLHFDQDQK